VEGSVRLARAVGSHDLAPRDIYVYLPPAYSARPRHRFPVLYLQDGQNVFDTAISFSGDWAADEAAEALARRRPELQVIIVAIPNGGEARAREYSPWSRSSQRWGDLHGLGEAYLDFVIHTVKPLVDASFRTRIEAAQTGIGGSSLGGLISLYGALTRPHIFGFCAAVSPALWFSFGKIFALPRGPAPHQPRIYLDIGMREGRASANGLSAMVSDARRMRDVLRGNGFDVAYVEDAAGTHDEASWRRRFPSMLEWFLDPRTRPAMSQPE
jgi:predicted alpha/beta superfamily hydrolase